MKLKLDDHVKNLAMAIWVGFIIACVVPIFSDVSAIPIIFAKIFVGMLLIVSAISGYLLLWSVFDIWMFSRFEYSKPDHMVKQKKSRVNEYLFIFWFSGAMAGIIFVVRHC